MLISHNGMIVCFNCNGKGFFVIQDQDRKCPECFGRGEYLDDQEDTEEGVAGLLGEGKKSGRPI
jgi:hypothetical protein